MADFITLVVNDTAEFPFRKEGLVKAKRLNVPEGVTKVVAASNVEVEFSHLAILNKILLGEQVLPMVTVTSHQAVLVAVRFAKELEVPLEDIEKAFRGWTENRRWIELWYPEYLYLLHNEMEELVNFDKFFRLHPAPFESLERALKLREVLANPTLYVEMLLFYKNYKFETIFKENNDQVQDRIDALKKQREESWKLFMVDPHTPELAEYFTYTVTNYDTWDCKGISAVPQLNPGETTIAGRDQAMDNLNKFAYGWLQKPVDPNYKEAFPWENVVVAGGSASRCVNSGFNLNSKVARQSDVDLFIFAKKFEDRAAVFEKVMRWFGNPALKPGDRPFAFYGIRGSVTTVELRDVKRKFQIISINCSNPYEIVARFDLTHIQWCMWNGKFYGTPEACRSSRERLTRFHNVRRLKAPRLIKAQFNGYQILKTEEALKELDISDLIENPNNDTLQKVIREFHKGYYPVTDLDMDPKEEQDHILSNIENDTGATLVTCDVDYVLNNVTVSGNFENDYESSLYSNFNPNIISRMPQNARITKTIVKSKHGAIRLTTCPMDVTQIANDENGVDLFVKVSKSLPVEEEEKFRNFITSLETNVYRMYRRADVTRKIFDDDFRIKFSVPRTTLNLQLQRGLSCLRNQQGKALDIETELKAGDQIQIMFLMEIVMAPQERSVVLKPVKFVKYVKYDPVQVQAQKEADAKIEAELATITAQAVLDSEIKYDDNVDN